MGQNEELKKIGIFEWKQTWVIEIGKIFSQKFGWYKVT